MATNQISENLVLPRYQDYCLANIPSTVLSLLGVPPSRPPIPAKAIPKKQYRHIVLILIDALGYLSFQEHQRDFQSLINDALITPITSIFPSTTAAAIPTIHTGVLPKKHGLFEWHLYFPSIGQTINTLPFCLRHSYQPDELLKLGYSPTILIKQKTIYQTLLQNHIKSFCFNHRSYAKSAFSRISCKGSQIIPFVDLADLFANLTIAVSKIHQKYRKTYIYVYIDYLDTIAHRYGPQSPQYDAEIHQIANMMQTVFLEKTPRRYLKDTLLIVTADHGQIGINPRQTIYLDRLRKLKRNLKTDPQGKPILATGSSRDVFLHIKKGKGQQTINYLKKKLGDKADIYSTKSETVKKTLFGPGRCSPRFNRRLGEILILPRRDHIIQFSRKSSKNHKLGHHGGLTAEEMLIPFITKDQF